MIFINLKKVEVNELADVAQSAERLAVNQQVKGSIPFISDFFL